jgi:hypothetical protein
MSYSFVKAKGRVSILKDGRFDHQQFRGHWAYRDPEAYIARLVDWDRQVVEEAALIREARLAQAAVYISIRADRKFRADAQLDLFA